VKIGACCDLTDTTVPAAEVARAVEAAWLDSFTVTQRIHVPASRADLLTEPGHEMDANGLDPFVSLTAAAVATSRIEIGTAAVYPALLDPIVLAKQVASLDVVSGGRFLFGITPGWLKEEIAAHGVDPATRWQVMREKVLALKQLWTADVASFDGEFVHLPPVKVGLRPQQRPHPPILVGSNGPRGLARALEYGDEWFPIVSHAALDAMPSPLPMPTTGFAWEADEPLVARCRAAGLRRLLVYLYPESREALEDWLVKMRTFVRGRG
jgi:probable F420-dependent oxidoreductase